MKKAYRTTVNGIMNPRLRREGTDPSIELPEVTPEDAGKVLVVDENGKWGASTAPAPLPEVTSADAGKVLMVDEQGAWNPAEASGGGGILFAKITTPFYEWGTVFNGTKSVTTNISLETIAQAFKDGKLVVISNGGQSTILIPDINQTIVNAYGYFAIKKGTSANDSYNRYYRIIFSSSIGSNSINVQYCGSVKLLDAES